MTASEFDRAVDITIKQFRRLKFDAATGERHYQPPLTDKEAQEGLWANDRLSYFNCFPDECQSDPAFVTSESWKKALARLARFYRSKAYKAYMENLSESVKRAREAKQAQRQATPAAT